MDYLLVAGGLVGLYFGAEWLLRGAIALAERMAIPTMLVSLVIVGFGTSVPELLVSVRAAMSGSSDISLGNVVGSNTANILLIVAVSALIHPITVWDKGVKRDSFIMMGSAVLLLALVQFDAINRVSGLFMIALLLAYIGYAYIRGLGAGERPEESLSHEQLSKVLTGTLIAGGLATLFVGAELLVRGATSLAREFGVSEAVIGLTVVAVGTSLPELATGVMSALRRHSDIMIGNVVGSNIFNVLFILGATAIIQPISVDPRFANFDVPVMLAVTLGFAALLLTHAGVKRLTAATMLLIYAGYNVALVLV
ncbi:MULTISPECIES: calcium/sodium antiporter [Alphaproteobacteria]|uniref:Sodium:calcium antiporter n=2 Tax=Alphaproteobacteria TaxID=28211 RepID=A0A512HGF2_9HYPH|nr:MULTISPECIES: calcium/sodium antiporter [Alphaproteobacteria]GEO84534.1 sodium:calcium antiporter [Ciceribacter naphthalenivorans]GLR22497.1 sodium:calcium antiporter [Ciceribacter naphthalenivorans]GLT05353.1 sodium:calcium antiporter [Sphingomonas psychrolutea]